MRGDRPPIGFDLDGFLKQATDFVSALGHLDFARYEQDGTEVVEPVFPWQLRYEPTGEINFPSDSYDTTLFE